MAQRDRTLLITDLDNTLWDWFRAWYESFSAMLARVSELSGIGQTTLEGEIRSIHQLRRTAEYSNLLDEIPSLLMAASPILPSKKYDEALHVLHSRRRAATALYPGVLSTLEELKGAGVRVVGYTESVAYWTEWRIRHTGLDGVIDVLYSAPDHDLPAGMTVEDLRTGHKSPDEYGLRRTVHRHTPRGAVKPNVEVLRSILADQECPPHRAVYCGDSLMKDVAMAQEVGVADVYAKYGAPQHLAEYELLRRVTHWSDEDVERERRIARDAGLVVPSRVCVESFTEILEAF